MLPISFLSDYGYRDEFVGVCHGVILRLAPEAQIIDISHAIPPHNVRAGALTLKRAIPFMPVGVHLAVVDPGVGTERRALALRCEDGNMFVGPDNGLLWPAIEQSGGVLAAADVSESPDRPEDVSATFHGRDVFAPAAARLSLDVPVEFAGEPIDPESVAKLELPAPDVAPGRISAHVLTIDRFGNLQLNVSRADLASARLAAERRLLLEAKGQQFQAIHGETFADAPPSQLVVFEDSAGVVSIAVNAGKATEMLGVDQDDRVTLEPCP